MGGYVQTNVVPDRRASVDVAGPEVAPAGASTHAETMNRAPRVQSLLQLKDTLDTSSGVRSQLALQRLLDQSAARQTGARSWNGANLVQRKSSGAGLPDGLKAGVEHLSGLAMDDVRVHYNSPKPAAMQAHAYAQGSDIHVGPGQERHLPHEAWHVVQQKQGRVKPTLQLKGIAVNDDTGLEHEADTMGARAANHSGQVRPGRAVSSDGAVVQRLLRLKLPGQAGEENYGSVHLNALWPNVAAIIDERGLSRWGRKKKFIEHLGDQNVANPGRTSLEDYVTFLIEKTPRAAEQGRQRPDWDPFWKSVRTSGLHRRHIVMSSVMRNAVYAVTDAAKAVQGDADKKKALEELTRLYGGLAGAAANNIEEAEAALVSKLHNHKLNIFIGTGSWNSAIGGLSHAIVPEIFLHKLESAADLKAVDGVKLEFVEVLKKAGVFGHEGPKAKAIEVATAMLEKTGTNWKGQAVADPDLTLIKEEIFEIVKLMSDSTTTDVSEASNDAIRQHQNGLFAFNARFQEIAGTGNPAALKATVQDFLKQEEGFPNSEPMDALAFFKGITSRKVPNDPKSAPTAPISLDKINVKLADLQRTAAAITAITTPKSVTSSSIWHTSPITNNALIGSTSDVAMDGSEAKMSVSPQTQGSTSGVAPLMMSNSNVHANFSPMYQIGSQAFVNSASLSQSAFGGRMNARDRSDSDTPTESTTATGRDRVRERSRSRDYDASQRSSQESRSKSPRGHSPVKKGGPATGSSGKDEPAMEN
jgi:uncharacterized protein DUF4157